MEKLNAMGLPMSDDYLYETFGIEKPENYDAIKAEKAAEKARMEEMRAKMEDDIARRLNAPKKPKEDGKDDLKNISNRLKSFFDLAPENGAQ